MKPHVSCMLYHFTVFISHAVYVCPAHMRSTYQVSDTLKCLTVMMRGAEQSTQVSLIEMKKHASGIAIFGNSRDQSFGGIIGLVTIMRHRQVPVD